VSDTDRTERTDRKEGIRGEERRDDRRGEERKRDMEGEKRKTKRNGHTGEVAWLDRERGQVLSCGEETREIEK
jgi:hypothetical protein